MEDFARGTVVGFAVSMTIPAMYYFNKAALGTLFAFNREIGKALVRFIIPPPPSPPLHLHLHPPFFPLKAPATTKNVQLTASAPATAITASVMIATPKKTTKLNPKYTSPCLTTSS